MIAHECEIKVITEGGKKKIVPTSIIKKPDPNEESMSAMTPKKKDTTALDKLIHYKIPVGPLVTLNFTTNPNILLKKKKEKKKGRVAKGKKGKKLKFRDIPLPKDNGFFFTKKKIVDLASSVIERRLNTMKTKYGLDDFMFSTEPILRWDPSTGDDPNRYLDFLREIDDELIKYDPYRIKFETLTMKKKQKLVEKSKEIKEKDGTETIVLDEKGSPIVRYKFKEKNNIKEYLDKSMQKVKDESKKELLFRKMEMIKATLPATIPDFVLIDETHKTSNYTPGLWESLSDSDEGEPISTFGEDLKEKLRNLNNYLSTGNPEFPGNRPDKIDLIYRAEDPVTGDLCSGGQFKDGLRVRAKFDGRSKEMVDFKVFLEKSTNESS